MFINNKYRNVYNKDFVKTYDIWVLLKSYISKIIGYKVGLCVLNILILDIF